MAKKGFQVIAQPKSGDFAFQLEGGDAVWRLPLLGSLPVSKARCIMGAESGTSMEQLEAVLDLMDELCPGLTDELTVQGVSDVLSAWSEASNITVGESRSSSD